ncbi:phage major capsid protein [Bifidobacterium sp. CP2]|uniref:phage major capsid protein n=1 Tax=Bifidobacterium sp. CP2 TaxID=2809025 RepID=UPI001BDBBD62|nr:phage major capsid protein [Bifidobacterium sp. CP2]MBT1181203.1 phage major capsid protein [Bifidobacterium sp. CP2]
MADPTMTRQSGGLDLTPETQNTIWQNAVYQSAFMQLVPQIPLPGKGVRVPIITGDPEADWVAEGTEKPKSGVGFDKKDMVPYTIAVILPFSNQFRRDFNAITQQVIAKGPQAIARKIDQTIMGLVAAPGADFDTLANAPQVSLGKTVWKSLNDADDKVTDADGTVDGWALSPQGRSILRQATDNNGRPLFLGSTGESDVSTVLGNRTYISKGVHVPAQAAGTDNNPPARPEIVGVAGEFASAAWGTPQGLQTSVSDQAPITIDGKQVNLWEKNIFAVRIEMEFGFRVRDINRFVLLTK